MDLRDKVITSLERSILLKTDRETVNMVIITLTNILKDYEITERCTELSTMFDAKNQKLIEVYIQSCNSENKKPSTLYAYKKCLQRFELFVNKDLTMVTSFDIRSYFNYIKEKSPNRKSDQYLKNEKNYLNAFYKFLVAEEVIIKNPMANIKKIKVDNQIKQAFSDLEIDKIRLNCKDLKCRAIIEILLSSGIRVSELCKLTLDDIEPTTLKLNVRCGKGGKDRITFISSIAYQYLYEYLKTKEEPTRYIFAGRIDKATHISTNGVQQRLKDLEKICGVTDIHPHRFRRTFATNCAKRGMPIQDIQKLLGHSNINVTMRYVVVQQNQLRGSYDKYA